jgi:hypothetical protein
MECAMRLTSTQVERTLRQFDGQAIPDNHPVLPQLNRLFGDHTFFLDGNGLNIVEPAEPTQAGVEAGKIVNVANWSDANLTSLAPHDPETTNVVVALGSKH